MRRPRLRIVSWYSYELGAIRVNYTGKDLIERFLLHPTDVTFRQMVQYALPWRRPESMSQEIWNNIRALRREDPTEETLTYLRWVVREPVRDAPSKDWKII